MLTDILWVIIFCSFVIGGVKRPYIALCGVIWIDTIKPQNLSYSFLADKSLSLYATLYLFISIALNFNQINLPKHKFPTFLILILMGWLTLCTYNAQFQYIAWIKYDYVIKTLLFSIFIPFVIDSRVKAEAFIGILVSSVCYFTMIGGLRTFMGDGGYGGGLVSSTDSGIAETSTLSMVSVFTLPMLFYIYKYSKFSNRIPYLKPIIIGLAFSCILTTIGTYARTGLVALVILFVMAFIYSKQKIKLLGVSFLFVLIAVLFAPQQYIDRMMTITQSSSESSALGRIVVWRWTIDYVSSKPWMGGGFNSYVANAGELHKYLSEDQTIEARNKSGKAFHNIYIEVLGESGYVGLFIYLLIIFNCWSINRKLMKRPDSDYWRIEMARTINIALVIYCGAGMFIGVAFSPWLYYFLGLASGVSNIAFSNSNNGNAVQEKKLMN